MSATRNSTGPQPTDAESTSLSNDITPEIEATNPQTTIPTSEAPPPDPLGEDDPMEQQGSQQPDEPPLGTDNEPDLKRGDGAENAQRPDFKRGRVICQPTHDEG